MRFWFAIACVMLAFGACKNDRWEQTVSELEGFRDRICGCKTTSGDRAIRKDCADHAEADMSAWEQAQKDKYGTKDKMPDEVKARGDRAGSELLACLRDIRNDFDAMKAEQAGSAAGSSDPDAAERAEIMAKMAAFKDEMCACSDGDKACGERVQKAVTDYGAAHKGLANMNMSAREQKQATDLGLQLVKCATKAMAPPKK